MFGLIRQIKPSKTEELDLMSVELQEQLLMQLRLISLKLNCLQPFDEELDADDLDELN